MRACLGVEYPEDLWFNQGIQHIEEDERIRKLNFAQEMYNKDLVGIPEIS